MNLDNHMPQPVGARAVHVTEHRGHSHAVHRSDWLAEEVPVAMVYNGISHAVMMASPLDLEDLALGFGLTEGILQGPEELRGVDVVFAGRRPHMADGI